MGRQRRASQNAGRQLPSKDSAGTGRALPEDPPDHLGEHAQVWYRWAVATATEMGIADEADQHAFIDAAELYQELRDAQALVKEHGLVFATNDKWGKPVIRKNPAVCIVQRARETLRWFRGDLGLSPAARAKFAPTAKVEDPFIGLLSG